MFQFVFTINAAKYFGIFVPLPSRYVFKDVLNDNLW